MGSVITTIKVGDLQGQNFQSVEVEADTGSTSTLCPGKCSWPWECRYRRPSSHGWP